MGQDAEGPGLVPLAVTSGRRQEEHAPWVKGLAGQDCGSMDTVQIQLPEKGEPDAPGLAPQAHLSPCPWQPIPSKVREQIKNEIFNYPHMSRYGKCYFNLSEALSCFQILEE